MPSNVLNQISEKAILVSGKRSVQVLLVHKNGHRTVSLKYQNARTDVTADIITSSLAHVMWNILYMRIRWGGERTVCGWWANSVVAISLLKAQMLHFSR